jgi:DNA-binding XRE family transcriptional regulator
MSQFITQEAATSNAAAQTETLNAMYSLAAPEKPAGVWDFDALTTEEIERLTEEEGGVWVRVKVLSPWRYSGQVEIEGPEGHYWDVEDGVMEAAQQELKRRWRERAERRAGLHAQADKCGDGYRRTELREQAAREAVAFQKTDGEAIRSAREAAGLTRVEFAAAVGVNPKTAYFWESGDYAPSEESARRIAEVLSANSFGAEPLRRRGRPLGSRNRPKPECAAVEALRSMERVAGSMMAVQS